MGTRALVRVFDGDAKTEMLCLYKQYDGYPSGLGVELQAFCRTRQIVNGICFEHDPTRIANGSGDLAALLVIALKHKVGGVYVEPPGASGMGEDYEYEVRVPPVPEDGGPVFATVEAFEVHARPSRHLEAVDIEA